MLLLENAREQISHLYFFKFFDFDGIRLFVVVADGFADSRIEPFGLRIKSIKVAGDGMRTLLLVMVY